MTSEDYVSIGKVIKPFGYKGEVKVLLDLLLEEGFEDIETLFLLDKNGYLPYFIEAIKKANTAGQLIIKLEGVDSKEGAAAFAGKEIFLSAEDIELEEERTYAFITNFEVEDYVEGPLGKIEDVLIFPHQELAQVFYKNKEVLFPLNETTVISIDEEKQQILVDLPEGLLEIYDSTKP